jgi:hypothetical protein
MISLLITSRKNDKFIGKLAMSILTKTHNMDNIEVLLMASQQDEWNKDLFGYLQLHHNFKIFTEDYGYGHWGLYQYFNELAKEASGDYLWYLCSDHDIVCENYDTILLNYFKEKNISPDEVWAVTPGFKDCGPVSHIITRKFYEITGRIAQSNKVDSWYNDLIYRIPENRRPVMSGVQIMTDYTPKFNDILSPDDMIGEMSKPGKMLENGSKEYWQAIEKDAQKLNNAI